MKPRGRRPRPSKRVRKKIYQPRLPVLRPRVVHGVKTLMSPKRYEYDRGNILKYVDFQKNKQDKWIEYIVKRYDVCPTSFKYLMLEYKDLKPVEITWPNFEFGYYDDCDRRFIVENVYIGGLWENAHANGILIDQLNERIYHFEPNGIVSPNVPIVSKTLAQLFSGIDRFKNYTFIPSLELCPYVGMQVIEREKHMANIDTVSGVEDGYCMAWTFLFIHYCITNPDVDPSVIVAYLLSKEDLTDIIRNYVNFLVNIGQS